MRQLPYADPGVPDTRSPIRMLTWIARGQKGTIAVGALYGVIWMTAQALMPFAIGRGVDAIIADAIDIAWQWAGVLLGLGVIQAGFAGLRHRLAVTNFLYAALRVVQIVTRHTSRTGPNLTREKPTGEVAATVSSDAMHIGNLYEVVPRFFGALVTYIMISVIVLNASTTLGLMVLLGVPALIAVTIPLIQPIQERQRVQRHAVGDLTSLGADTVAGLRVLRGVGGESMFARRYGQRSEHVRSTGVVLARSVSLLDALMVLLPGVFLVALTWLGAHLVIDGSIGSGTLVSLYGYAFFLLIPVRTVGEMAFVATRAAVGCRRVIEVLSVGREVPVDAVDHASDRASDTAFDRTSDRASGSAQDSSDGPAWSAATLSDPLTGTRIEPGRLTMVVADDPEATAAIADRLGRLTVTGTARVNDIALSQFPLSTVREHIVVSDPEPTLFTGSLRSGLDPTGRHDDATLWRAISTAAADDVLETLPDGLDSQVEERGRSFSGGQRQRVALARTLVLDPDVLVLVEPTSAVDAHTEAAVAAKLANARRGRTTVVVTASPLLLGHADEVVFIADGAVVATGTHDHLLATEPLYRWTVTRSEAPQRASDWSTA